MDAHYCSLLIDGVSDQPRESVHVLVEDGVVVDVLAAEDSPPESVDETFDHSDHVVVPGMIDAHVHLNGARSLSTYPRMTAGTAERAARATSDARALLSAGFTTVRDMGSTVGLGLKSAIEADEIRGPRIASCGKQIAQLGGHGDTTALPFEWATSDQTWRADPVSGVEACRETARKRIRDGVDHLKVMGTGGVISEQSRPEFAYFTEAELRAITTEAHRVGIPVACHGLGAAGINQALDCGVDTIEHGAMLDAETVDNLRTSDVQLVSTLNVLHRLTTVGSEHDVPDYGIEKAEEMAERHRESLRMAYEAGVPIAFGTDTEGHALTPHGNNALEAELLVEHVGLSEMEVVQSATSVAADALNRDDVGAVRPDACADLVVLGSNPLDDVSALHDVQTVFKDGAKVSA